MEMLEMQLTELQTLLICNDVACEIKQCSDHTALEASDLVMPFNTAKS
jgi:hypothetical protein